MASGRLGAAQLARLGDMLDRLREQEAFRIVLIHHPPLGMPRDRFKRLADAAALRGVIARHGAELLLHGHAHVHSLAWLDGPDRRVPAIGVPSASSTSEGHDDAAAYRLFRIAEGGNGWQCEMITRGIRDGAIVEVGRSVLS